MEQKLRRDRDMGGNLRTLREAAGYSQETLCAALQLKGIDISRATYQRYENNTLNIKIRVLQALKDLYQCSFSSFFQGLDEDAPLTPGDPALHPSGRKADPAFLREAGEIHAKQTEDRKRSVGGNLRALRDAAGLSQEKLCKSLQAMGCEISRTTYEKYENGELNIKISILIALRRLYSCSYEDLLQ